MSWWAVVPEFLVAFVIVFVPGFLIGRTAGVRGFALLALAPGLSVTAISASAVLAPLFGVPWSIGPVLVMTALSMIFSWLAKFVWLRFRSRTALPNLKVHDPTVSRAVVRWAPILSVTGAVALATATLGVRLATAFGQPDSFSQTFDNVFHLNAIRFILDTGSGSSLNLANMTGGGFYPAAWHDLVSLVVQLTDSPITVAVNVVNICIGALIWPLSCIYLARVIAGPTMLVTWTAAVLSAAFGAFPLLMVNFGVLYPNFLGISFLPATLALGLISIGLGSKVTQTRFTALLVLGFTIPGLSLAHPSSLMALLAFMVPGVLFQWWKSLRISVSSHGYTTQLFVRHGAIAVGAFAVFAFLWINVRPSKEAAFWPAIQSPPNAVVEVLTSSAIDQPFSWVVAILALVGLASVLLRPSKIWIFGIYATAALLYVVASSFRSGRIRDLLTGIWYNDPPRLAALLPMVILPIAVLGAVELWTWIQHRLIRTSESFLSRQSLIFRCLSALGIVVLLASTQQANVNAAQAAAASKYQIDAVSPLLSSDELALLMRLDAHVPADSIIVGNPSNGSSLAYAFADRKTLQLHILGAVPEGGQLIYDHLRDGLSNPDVCAAVRNLNVGYVLDFGRREVNFDQERPYGFLGLDDLASSGMVDLVDSQGEAKLFRITACN